MQASIFSTIFSTDFHSIVQNAFYTFWIVYITTHLYVPTLYYATPTPLVHNTLTLCLHHSGFVVRGGGGGVVYLLLCPHVYVIKTSVNSSPVHNITRLHNIKSTLLVLTLLNLSITQSTYSNIWVYYTLLQVTTQLNSISLHFTQLDPTLQNNYTLTLQVSSTLLD